MKKQLFVIGVGPGSSEYITAIGQSRIIGCDEVYSAKRLTYMLSSIRSDIKERSISAMIKSIRLSKAQVIGVLVSGDTGFFSMCNLLIKELQDDCEIEVICGISSLQFLCARLHLSYENIKIVSLHGRNNNILGAVSYNERVFVLTGGENKAHHICENLSSNGLGHVNVIAGENLSMPIERILKGTAKKMSLETFDDLTVLLIENEEFTDAQIPLKDSDFTRGNIPMTKEEIRDITVSKLAITSNDIIYDVGAGTGSVSIQMARKAKDGLVYAIEQKSEGIDLIKKNKKKLGSYNLIPIHGKAPEALEGLPAPNKVFIGGSAGEIESIIGCVLKKNPKVKIVMNAITLETLHQIMSSLSHFGIDYEAICVNISVSEAIGSYHMMKANNPVYIISSKEETPDE